MDSHWIGWFCYTIVGTVFVGIGGLSATYGWNVWSRQSEVSKLVRKGMGKVILGIILVAVGGLLTTYGWELRSFELQKKNLIKAVEQLWVFNDARLQSPPLKGKVYYVKDDGKHGLGLFPAMNTSALNGIMSSGLWNFDGPNETEFLMAVYSYERALTTASKMFDRYNDHLISINDVNERIAQSEQYQNSVSQAEWFINLKNRHKNIGGLPCVKHRPVLRDKDTNDVNGKSPREE